MSKSIAIIGAGPAGLICAYQLQKLGLDPVLFEKESFPGGRTESHYHNQYLFYTGAILFSEGYELFLKLCKELGLSGDWYTYSDEPLLWFYFRNQLYNTHVFSKDSLPFSHMLRFAIGLMYGFWKWRKRDLFDILKKNRPIDLTPARSCLLKLFSSEEIDEIISPLFYSIFTLEVDDINTNLLAELFNFLFVKTKNRKLYSFKQGTSVFYQALEKKIREQSSTKSYFSTPIHQITAHSKYVEVQTNEWNKRFDAVVLAVPAPHAKQIYQNPTEAQKEIMNGAKYNPCIIILFEIPLAPIKNTPIIAFSHSKSPIICSIACLDLTENPSAVEVTHSSLHVYLYQQVSIDWMNLSDKEIFSRTKEELKKIHPPFQGCEIGDLEIRKHPFAMSKSTGNYASLVQRFWEQGQGEQNVYLCSDYLSAPNMEGAARCGQLVANRLAQALKK